jgi:hypothetical protein
VSTAQAASRNRSPRSRGRFFGASDDPHPCGMMPPLVLSCPRAAAASLATAAVPGFRPAAGDAHLVTTCVAALMGWRGPIRQPAPAAGCASKTSPPRGAGGTAENSRPDARHVPVRRAVRRPGNGTKRARIGKASG